MQHNLAVNVATTNLVVRLVDEEGRAGYGEGIPRHYVTGEDPDVAIEACRRHFFPDLIGADLTEGEILQTLQGRFPADILDRTPAAACAVETALWDLASRRLGVTAGKMLGGIRQESVTYSAVIPLVPPHDLRKILGAIQHLGLNQIKVKVGRRSDVDWMDQIRQTLGPEVRLRIDANGAWSAEEAVEKIGFLTRFGIEAVEQPVAKEDLDGLQYVTERVKPIILADESLCTADDARTLIERRAVGGFNLRLSKCGGPSRTMKLLRMAREAGLVCMLGCQVGELGVLSAAGRQFATAQPDLIYLEGSLTRFLVERDIIAEDLAFGPGGGAPALTGPGLGVNVLMDRLADSHVYSLS